MVFRLHYNAADSRARSSDEWHETWISKSGLKARNWTDKAISDFLGSPQKAGPIMAWTLAEMRRAEQTNEFKQWMVKRRKWLRSRGKLPANVE